MEQFPVLILLIIFNKLSLETDSEEFKNQIELKFYYYRYLIGCCSLLSRDWNENRIKKLKFNRFRISNFNQIKLVSKWVERGIMFKYIDTAKSIISNEIKKNKDQYINEIIQLLQIIFKDYKQKDEEPLLITKELIDNNREIYDDILQRLSAFAYDSNYLITLRETMDTDSTRISIQELNKLETFIESLRNKRLRSLRVIFSVGKGNHELFDCVEEYNVKELCIFSYNRVNPICQFKKLEITKLVIHDQISLSQEVFDNIINNCSKLVDLQINNSEFRGTDMFSDSLINHKSIKSLSIIIDSGGFQQPFERLVEFINQNNTVTDLTLSGHPMRHSKHTNTWSINNTTLKSIKFWKVLQSNGDNRSLIKLWKSKSALEHFTFDLVDMNRDILDYVRYFHPNISEFTCNYIHNLPLFIHLQSPNITTLSLSDCSNFDLLKIVDNKFIKNLKITTDKIGKSIIEDLIKDMDWLEYLTLTIKNLETKEIPLISAITNSKSIKQFEFNTSTSTWSNNLFNNSLKQLLNENNILRKLTLNLPMGPLFNNNELSQILIEYYKNHKNPIPPDSFIIIDSFNSSIDTFKFIYKNS